MAEVRLTPEKIGTTGLAATYTGSLSAANTYMVRNTGRTFVHVKKSGAGECTMTIETPKTVGGLAVADQTVTIPASTGDKFVGPFPPHLYNDDTHDVNITFDEITGLTIAVLEV